MRELFERGGDLINLLHARTGRTAANQHDHVALRDLSALDGLNRGGFRRENSGRPHVTIDVVFVDERRIDGGALDDGALRRQIADGKTDGLADSPRPGLIGRHNHVVRIDTVVRL